MTTLADLRRELPEFREANRQDVEDYLLEGFQELCKETWAWAEDIVITTSASTHTYALTPTTTSTAVCGIMEAVYTDSDNYKHDIPLTNRENLLTESESWQTDTSSGTSISYIMYDGATCARVYRTPIGNTITVTVRCALYPTASVSLPGVIERHKEAIKAYARWKLYLLPKEIAYWANSRAAEYFRGYWETLMLKLKIKKTIGFGGARRARMRWWC